MEKGVKFYEKQRTNTEGTKGAVERLHNFL